MPKISTMLWFDGQAEEAAKFYVSVFPKAKIVAKTPGPGGKPMTVVWTLDGREMVNLNGGPHYKFTEAISFVIPCRSQKEIDSYWKKLLAGGGQPSMCGWLKDRFGVSWQVIPENLGALISTPEGAQAMFAMQKLDIAALKAAGPKKAAPKKAVPKKAAPKKAVPKKAAKRK